MNIAIITGRVGKDPNVRTLQGKKGEFKAADFSVAVNFSIKDADPLWVKVQTLGYAAEFVEKYIKKGSAVLVRGELQEQKYKDKKGEEQRVWHIQAEEVKQMWSANGNNTTYTKQDDDTEDLPF